MRQKLNNLSESFRNNIKKKGGNDASSTAKSTRGRKAGNITALRYGTLREIINREPNEKPEEIFRILMATFDNDLPVDLPMDNDTPDKKDHVDNFQIQNRIKEECQKKYPFVMTLQYHNTLLISNDLYVS